MYQLIIVSIAGVLGLFSASDAFCSNDKKDTPSHEKHNALKEALTSAYLTNSALKSKLYNQYAKDEDVSIAASKFRPTLQAKGSAGKSTSTSKRPDLPSSTTRLDPESVSLQAQQNIYRGGTDSANLRAAKSAAIAGQYDLMSTEQKVLFDSTKAYMDVIFQTASVKSNTNNVSYLEKLLSVLRAQLEVGEKTEADVAASEAELARGQAALVKSQGDLATAKATYTSLIGESPTLLDYPSPLPNLPSSLDEVINDALKSNSEISKALHAATAAGLSVDAATGALLPSLDLNGTASKAYNQSIKKDRTAQASATLTLTVPIYQSGSEWATIRQQADKSAAARYDLEQARKSAREGAITAWDNWVTAKQQIASFKVQVASAKIARDRAQDQAEAGELSSFEVLQYQQKLLEAQIALEDAKRNEILAQFQLYSITGKLTARELELPVTLNDVQGHLDDVSYKTIGFGNTPAILDGKNE